MYIRRVIIKGFKTYRNETVIDDFSPHHNIVIGSNGSGKSNFFAAIRFVLSGDYSNLKREERQGLIHQGSGSVMSASVEIVFHDPDHRIILPSGVAPRSNDEVLVRRTVGLKKDDYQLNDRNVTKGDVVRMLESAGFSMNNPYNIVPQGRIIALTNAKDKERLQLLEDVVGAKSFEVKLRASLKKMEQTEQKRAQIVKEMEELNDKLSEMEEERKELEVFNNLERNRKAFQFTLYDRELNDVINQIEKMDDVYNVTLHSSHDYITELDKREDMVEQINKNLQNLESSIKIKETAELSQARSKHNELSNAIANLNVKIRDLQRQVVSYDEQSDLNRKNLAIINEAIEAKQAQLAKISPRFESLSKEEVSYKLELAGLQEKQRDLLLMKGKYSHFQTVEERNEWIEGELRSLNETLANTTHLKSQIDNERNELHEKLNATEEQIQELEDSVRGPGVVAEIEDIEKKVNDLKAEYVEKINERKELWRSEQKLQTISETLLDTVKNSERSVSETMAKSLANGIASVREITEKLRLPEGRVFGTLGELIKVNEKYKMCAEVVGGNSLFHIVVDTDETASLMIQELYRMRGGRVTFMPLNRIYNDPNITYPPNAQSSCTPLIKKIKFDAQFESVVKNVFGKTIVVRDLAAGSKIAKHYKLDAITLDGDRADKSGLLTGGYHEHHKKTRLESLKDLKNARTQYKKTSDELEQIRQKIHTADAEIDSMNGQIRVASNKRETILTNVDGFRTKLNNKLSEKLFLEESAKSLELKREKAETSIKVVQAKIDSYTLDLTSEFETQISAQKQKELNDLEITLQKVQKNLNTTTEALQGITTKIDSLTAELNSKLLPQKSELQASKHQDGDVLVADLKSDLELMISDKQGLEKQFESSGKEVDELQTELEGLKAEKGKNESLLEKANSQQAQLLKKLETFQKDAEKSMVKKTTLASRREELQRKIREVGLLAEEALNSFSNLSSEELLRKLNAVNEDISGLKNVNKKAFENFKKFHEKKLELEDRSKELDESKTSIQNLIVKLKQQKVAAVDSTFENVSRNFTEVFEQLVPRGKAKLVIHRSSDARDDDVDAENDTAMTGDDDGTQTESMYTGVSISVSFNSKKTRQLHVEQLSGGQKTVCAVALILAIQMVDPAPFYLFDEIDAALDKQYRTAVAGIIKALSANAQFICTTFRTDMLQVADKFFRVKYENKISTVVEVDRQEAINFIKGTNKLAEV
ncbi:cohesin subunit SMC3 TDEL_0D01620 [Torulaspora delbrueckii]|uniref:Structural maintenance of chromosomes protein n=1 Tax=Torulaspora delbrueckii TaxID=4950 RepID=G8ZT02_TORDE|nr:hypothetical protein TDEL_0D01620 [Torulaspora delbrueckii]CCE91746.1 hypothetical protein TDEL_0D01620 [Torulaspora delbrueckii]